MNQTILKPPNMTPRQRKVWKRAAKLSGLKEFETRNSYVVPTRMHKGRIYHTGQLRPSVFSIMESRGINRKIYTVPGTDLFRIHQRLIAATQRIFNRMAGKV